MNEKKIAVDGVRKAVEMYLNGLEHLPEEAYAACLGGKARLVADITYEVTLVNQNTNLRLQGLPAPAWPEGWVVAPEELRGKAAAIDAFRNSAEELLATMEALPPEAFDDSLASEIGKASFADRSRFVALHLWYHCGQLNFAQALLGDDSLHW